MQRGASSGCPRLVRSMRRLYVLAGLSVVLAIIVLVASTATPRPAADAGTPLPTLRPTFPFPSGASVPVTSADGVIIENETGPLYAMLSTVDEHGLPGDFDLDLTAQPNGPVAGSLPSGVFAQVLEIRRLPPDYLRTFYRVRVPYGLPQPLEGWVGDWYVRRTVFVIRFDEKGCVCQFLIPLWADPDLTQPGGQVMNRSPLRLIGLTEKAVQVQVLADGSLGWLDRDSVYESQDNEFIRRFVR